jgi:putative acetyltransferase
LKNQEIIIREYKPEDAQALANIYYNTIHQINIQHYTEEQVNAWAPKTGVEWEKKFEKTKPLVALDGNIPVGFAEFEPDGHIDCFYTHHQYIGCGVGTSLMAVINEKALKNGIKRIYAEVSITARPFFEKQGFIVTQEQTVKLRGVDFINYKMEKHISAV